MKIALTLENLNKVYDNKKKAINNVSLEVLKGDIYALLGPNGAGKTTLMGIISSLIKKTTGKVLIFNYDIDKNLIQAKKKIGVVPQEFNFNQFEIVKDILINQAGYYGIERKKAKIRCEKYLKELNLWEKRNVQARLLSGGMKRRLMIARSLIHKPDLLILDEPTAGVDVELRKTMWDFLKIINSGGTTIILTTHYLEEAENICNNVGIIQEGCIIENSSIKNILKKIKIETFIFDVSYISFDFFIRDYSYRILDNYTIEVDVFKNQSLNYLFHQFSEKKIDVFSFRNKTNRLETVFLSLIKKGDC